MGFDRVGGVAGDAGGAESGGDRLAARFGFPRLSPRCPGALFEADRSTDRGVLLFPHHLPTFPRDMNISIFGLGYVGAVTAGCLAQRGHTIVGVDVHAQKVEAFNEGIPPIVEPGLEGLLREAKRRGLLRATLKCEEAIADTEVSIVCVGTPSKVSGALDLSFVRGVTEQIAQALRRKVKSHALVFRSTVLPGSTAQLTRELLSDLMAIRLLQ